MSSSTPARIHVLHVDDDPGFADLTATALEREDDRFVVETAADADAGLDALASGAVDCVVSDYDMPGRNGIEFLRAVREEYPDLPFVLFTGKGGEEVASDAISAGVTDYLQKEGGLDQYTVLANRITNAVERYEAERERRQWKRAVETASEGIAILDEDGTYRQMNEAYAATYGTTPEELIGAKSRTVYPDDEAEYFSEVVRPSLRENGTWEGEAVAQRVDGTRFEQKLSLAALDEGGHVCVMRDISDRRERERELQRKTERLEEEIERREEAERRYRSLFENNPVVIWVEDFSAAKRYVDDLATEVDDLAAYLADTPEELDAIRERVEVIDVNENAIDYYGAETKAEVIENLDQLMTEESRAVDADLWASIAAGETAFRAETVSRTLDGDRRYEILELYVPEAYADDYSRVYITGTDVTERRRRERELRRQNERLNEFTSIVSHDLRNPLSLASGRLDLARAECDSDHLDGVAECLDRMDSLVEDLLTLAQDGRTVTEFESVSLADAARRCWEGIDTGRATLTAETDAVVRADPDRLRQLFENLFQNAIKHGAASHDAGSRREGADSGGPAVTVTVGSLPDGQGQGQEQGFYVADDGPGIPPADRDRAFEFGYSATDSTGFGLGIVREMADAQGWAVSVTDSDDGGARFEITGVETVEQ